MTRTAYLINALVTLLLLVAVSAKAVSAAPYLYFEPAAGNYSLGESFSVTAKINSGTETVGGADGVGVYDSTRLELVSVTQASDMVFSDSDGGGSCQIDTPRWVSLVLLVLLIMLLETNRLMVIWWFLILKLRQLGQPR